MMTLMMTRNDCPRCGLPVTGGSYELRQEAGRAVYQHTTCPTSDALANLPAISSAAVVGTPYLTIREAAALLRVSPSTIRLRIRRRLLPARRLRGGQTVLIHRDDALALLDDVHDAATPRPKTKPAKPAGIPVARPIGVPLLPRPKPLPTKPRTHGHALPDIDRTQILGEICGGVALSAIPTALLTKRGPDKNGNYPGGIEGMRAEEAELKRRTGAKLGA